jgi:tetratricopeptide (TPR) repeat protein
VIDIPRDDVVVMLEAGYIYLAMKKFKEAKELFEGVCTLTPKHDVPQVALSCVYFTQTKFMEAIRILKQAIKDNPKSAFAYSHLGESQIFYGKREEAYESLRKAVALDPKGKSGEFAKSLIQLLDTGYDPKEYREAYKKAVKKAQDDTKKESRK